MTSIRIDVHAEAAIRNGKVAIFVKLPSWMMEEGCLQKGLQPEGVIKVKLFKSEAA